MQQFPPSLLVLSPRPVATGSPAGDALENVNTFPIADGTLCYVESVKSPYQLDKSSVAAANGTTIVAPIAGPGRWFLGGPAAPGFLPLGSPNDLVKVTEAGGALQWTSVPPVYIAPLGTGADDWPRLNALMQTYAYQRPIVLGAGTWQCKTRGIVPSGTVILGDPGVTIQCTLGILGVVTNAPFSAEAVYPGTFTTLTANNVVGTRTFSLLGNLGGALVVGALIQARHGLQDMTYTVTNVVGGGPYTVTVDRPVLMQFSLGDPVYLVTSMPQDIRIDGKGMTITGTCDRFIELGTTRRCRVSGLRLIWAAGVNPDLAASFDLAGYDNVFEDIKLDGGGTRALGLALESQERSFIINCEAYNHTSYGIALYDCTDSHVENSRAYQNQNGIVFVTDGGTVGCLDCTMTNCEARLNTVTGLLASLARRCKFVACSSRFNTQHGLQFDGGADNIFEACEGSDNGGSGIVGSSAATGTVLGNCTANRNTGVGVNMDVACEVINLSVGGGGAVGVYLNSNAGEAHLDNVRVTNPGTTGIQILAGVRAKIANARVTVTAGNIGILVGGVAVLDRVTCTDPGGGAGIFVAATATLRYSDLDLSASSGLLPAGGSFVNVGQLVANGTGAAQAVAWPDLKATDHVTWTRIVGAPGPVPPLSVNTPATGFAATFAAGDVGTYEYRVE